MPLPTIQRLRDDAMVRVRRIVRRAAISLASASGLWQLTGYEDADEAQEIWDEVEVFPGIGFWSRPAAGGKPEAILVSVGSEGGHPVVVATRDKSCQIDLVEGETAIFNSAGARVLVKADGTVRIEGTAGGAEALATQSDLTALKAAFDVHTHLYAPGPGAPVPTAIPVPLAPTPTCTTVLRGK
ncbi:MAG: phage baseplate assembly protein [Pseudomonadota bacterium]